MILCFFYFADDYVGLVLGAVGSISVLVTMGVMIELHNRKLNRWVTKLRGSLCYLCYLCLFRSLCFLQCFPSLLSAPVSKSNHPRCLSLCLVGLLYVQCLHFSLVCGLSSQGSHVLSSSVSSRSWLLFSTV